MSTSSLDARYAAAMDKLKTFGQEHALKFYDELNDDQKDKLLSQIESLDFSPTQYINNRGSSRTWSDHTYRVYGD